MLTVIRAATTRALAQSVELVVTAPQFEWITQLCAAPPATACLEARECAVCAAGALAQQPRLATDATALTRFGTVMVAALQDSALAVVAEAANAVIYILSQK